MAGAWPVVGGLIRDRPYGHPPRADRPPATPHFPAPAGHYAWGMSDERAYVLGTDDEELIRLGIQHRLWSESAARLWELGGIRPGSRVLDVGSGPGYATLDLAQLVGSEGRVVAVDASARFVGALRERARALGLGHVEAHVGDVRDLGSLGGLPEGECFDAAWIRWVLCFLSDPAPVIEGIARRLRPGGRLIVQDYFNYTSFALAPRRAIFEEVIASVARSWREAGGDPDVMARVPRAMRMCGLEVVDLRVTQRVARHEDPAWQWPTVFWRSFLPRLAAGGFISEQQRAEFMSMWEQASQDPDTFLSFMPVFGIVGRKA